MEMLPDVRASSRRRSIVARHPWLAAIVALAVAAAIAVPVVAYVVVPALVFEHLAWERRFDRTVGWSFAIHYAHASDRALFCVRDGAFIDLGTRADLAEVAV